MTTEQEQELVTAKKPNRKSAGDAYPPSSDRSEESIANRLSRSDYAECPSSSLSSASSFQSLAGSLSSKCSSGICADSPSGPGSPDKASEDRSYINADIPDLDDLISACAGINIDDFSTTLAEESPPPDIEKSESNTPVSSQDLSHDQTFTSAHEDSFEAEPLSLPEQQLQNFKTCRTLDDLESQKEPYDSPTPTNEQQGQSVVPYVSLEECLFRKQSDRESAESVNSYSTCAELKADSPSYKARHSLTPCEEISISEKHINANVVDAFETCQRLLDSDVKNLPNISNKEVDESPLEQLNQTVSLPTKASNNQLDVTVDISEKNQLNVTADFPQCKQFNNESFLEEQLNSLKEINSQFYASEAALIKEHASDSVLNDSKIKEKSVEKNQTIYKTVQEDTVQVENFEDASQSPLKQQLSADAFKSIFENTNSSNQRLKDFDFVKPKAPNQLQKRGGLNETIPLDNQKQNLDVTAILNETAAVLPHPEPEYEAFQPQQQSTTLVPPNQLNFKSVQESALAIAEDLESSLDDPEASVVSATDEIFQDASAFDFLTLHGQTGKRNARTDSLYLKFDPLANRDSMLPQKNKLPVSKEEEEKHDKTEESITECKTPKKNPGVAAIDRLLFYSPPSGAETEAQKQAANQEKVPETKKEEVQHSVPVLDKNMVKELEVVRTTVLQLEEEREKQKESYEEKLRHCQDKINQLLTQQEQMSVVVEEYEKSISRVIAEREKDKTKFETEKTKLEEELQQANQHLNNTEAAFNDVHSKYEKLKNIVTVYKNNEQILKQSIIENQDVIKTLENRYEELKSHTTAQLEKANMELITIRKQYEADMIKLKALLRKSELKNKSYEETVEQKIKENKELTKIIDEMIARVE